MANLKSNLPLTRGFIEKSITREDFLLSIFDPTFYVLSTDKDLPESSALQHFHDVGAAIGASPNPLFHPNWYTHQFGLDGASSLEALDHFLEIGSKADAAPHPLFSPALYRERTLCGRHENALLHYIESSKEKRDMFASPSNYFDGEYYRRINPDVAEAQVDPLMHYLKWGWREYRNPSPYFNVRWYLSKYQDIANAGVEPLGHFLSAGIFEGRQPHHLIDLTYYASGAPDVLDAGMSPYLHYILYGDREGRCAHPLFNANFYAANGDPLGDQAYFAHYSEIGAKGLRSPCPAFDAAYYLLHNPHATPDPLLDYCLSDRHGQRHFHPLLDGDFQRLTSDRTKWGLDSLSDYVQFRSHFNTPDLWRAATFIPRPSKALLPSRNEQNALPPADEPLVSVVVPCYNSSSTYLRACVESVVDQGYGNWELLLVDDGSPDAATWPLLQSISELDERIRPIKLPANKGISGATNHGVLAAKGEFIALLDHDDVLTVNALSVMMGYMVREKCDAAYSDQVYITAWNAVDGTFFKPGWSPTLLAGVMYVGHFLIVKTAVALEAGLFDSSFDGCQDFEFMLRVSEKTKHIGHVPQILYQWRRAEGSIASNSDAKGAIEPKQARAVDAHFSRIGFPGKAVIDKRVPHRLRIAPSGVSLKDKVDIVLRNDSVKYSRDELAAKMHVDVERIGSVIEISGDTSPYQALLKSESPWIHFCDPAIQYMKNDWINYLLMHATRDDAAFISTHAYGENGEVVAAGYVASPIRGPIPAYVGAFEGQDGSAGTLLCDREVAVVNATCALVGRDKLTLLGGISPEFSSLDGAINDISYRATVRGMRNISVATPIITASRNQSISSLSRVIDAQIFGERHAKSLEIGDPYYNPNFALDAADFK